MRKLIYGVIAVALLSCIALNAASKIKTRTVTVDNPGSLENKLRVKDLKGVDRVTVRGVLNNDDVVWLRYLCGSDTALQPTDAYITDLNIGDVSFDSVSGRSFFAKTTKAEYGVVGPHVLPACMFYGTKIERLVLPEFLDSVAPFSLSVNRLEELIIPDGVGIGEWAVCGDSCLHTLRMPAMSQALMPKNAGLPLLRSISFGSVDYVPSASFGNMAELETVVFEGSIGHIDGYQFNNNPKLKTVTFNGPILTTGGPTIAENCPELESVVFNGYVPGLGLTATPDCPKIDSVTVCGEVNPADFDVLTAIAEKQMAGKGFFKRMAYMIYPDLDSVGRSMGYDVPVERLQMAYDKYFDPDANKSKLQILKESAPYSSERDANGCLFTYATPSDSLLALSRNYYNLDSIAGVGDDLSKIRNLLYWVHDLVPHDGSSRWPDCPLTLRDIDNVCKEQQRGVNCRMMAIMLTEALLAEGIPARYLTCLSKAYEEDPDCHVICVAWSRELGKWVWVDPTFCAYVTDENGTWLHPGEVRERLRNDFPLVLNEDANWNHKSNIDKEYYLGYYMAKNLYVIESRLRQEAAPEGQGSNRDSYVALVPVGFEYFERATHTSDPDTFWAPPTE